MLDLFLDTFAGASRQLLARTGWEAKHTHGDHDCDWDAWNLISLDGHGHLKIEAKYDLSSGRWKSGWLTGTIPLTGPRRLECRMKCTIETKGFFPAFWEWPYPYGTAYTPGGKVIPGLSVDVVSILTRELSAKYNYHHVMAHSWKNGRPELTTHKQIQDLLSLTKFQTYAADILPDQIVYYFNGDVVYTIKNTDLKIDDFTKFTNVLNLSIDCGSDESGPIATTQDQHILFDYIRASRLIL